MSQFPSGRMLDLTLPIEDNMTAHKMFQSPIVIPHKLHKDTLSFGLGVPGDPMTFQTNFLSMLD
ncbi:MAG: cyclase family protein, partial [Enterovirga sp.]|nr:cyclase family protein [Enterovirga sp.]